MPPPGSPLRAPLLWLLLPFMTGLAAAGCSPSVGRTGLAVSAVVLAAAGIVSLRFARRDARSTKIIWGVATGLLVAVGGGTYLLGRLKTEREWTFAPREVVLSVRIEQLFPGGNRKSISGLGRITGTDAHTAELAGAHLYFSAIRKISLRPQRSGVYSIRGVLQGRNAAGPESGFARYLDSLGLRLELTRAQIVLEEQPPGRLARAGATAEVLLEAILRRGLEKHPEISAVYLGMLLGEKAALDPEQQAAFMRSGTFHIFIIAGLHIGMIFVALRSTFLLLRMPSSPAILLSLGLVWAHVLVTGAGLPARRAFLMIAFLEAGRLCRQPANALAALTAAALVLLLWDPQQVFSAGFQMSFAVVVSLIVMGAPLGQRWQENWQPWRDLPEINWSWRQRAIRWTGRHLLGAMAISWAAFVACAPAGIGYFGVLSPGSILANLAVIPLAQLIIAAGVASLLCGLLHVLVLSAWFNHAAAVLIKTMSALVVSGARLPGIYFPAQFKAPWMAPGATALIVGTILAGAALRWDRRTGGFLLPALALVLVLFFGVKFG